MNAFFWRALGWNPIYRYNVRWLHDYAVVWVTHVDPNSLDRVVKLSSLEALVTSAGIVAFCFSVAVSPATSLAVKFAAGLWALVISYRLWEAAHNNILLALYQRELVELSRHYLQSLRALTPQLDILAEKLDE